MSLKILRCRSLILSSSLALSLLSGLFILFLPSTSLAYDYFDWFWDKTKTRQSPWSLSVELGGAYTTHYNRVTVSTTPPDTMMGQLRFLFWYRRTAAFYLLGASTPAGGANQSMIFGGGIRLPFFALSAVNRNALIAGVALYITGDVVQFKYPTPAEVFPQGWQPTGISARGGMGIDWGISHSSFYVDTQVLFMYMSENFMFSPSVSLGYQF